MTTPPRQLGIIGLGLLGSAISNRLIAIGWELYGYDLSSEQCHAFQLRGGIRAESAFQVIQQCDVVLLSLPTSEIVGELLHQVSGAFRVDQVIVDTTTGRPQQMVDHARQLQEFEVQYVEATVGGSSSQMEAGSALLFLGGEKKTIESKTLQELFSTLSSRVFQLGDVGSASRFKLVHNLVLGLNRAVLAEGLSFATSLGFEAADVLSILKQSAAQSAVMETKGPKMVAGDFSPQARLSQHLKDVRIIEEEARLAETPLPMTHLHKQLLEIAESMGLGEADNSAILQAIQNWKQQ